MDQLTMLIELLRREPYTRRAVLSMWDPESDLGVGAQGKKDLPCNTHAYFKIRGGKLNMTVCCRSNDIILGAYGANAVHFSMLHALVAAGAEVYQGTYTHISDSWHYYVDNPYVKKMLEIDPEDSDNHYENDDTGYTDYYTSGAAGSRLATTEVVNTDWRQWLDDARRFTEGGEWNDSTQYGDSFFWGVAVPVRDAYAIYKRGDIPSAVTRCQMIQAPDWRKACVEWLVRRAAHKEVQAARVDMIERRT